jgi:hypothetical protein
MTDDRTEEVALIARLVERRSELAPLLDQCSSHWGFEDPVYRFYHQSYKLYALQATTQAIVGLLRSLAPHRSLNTWFAEIVEQGTGRQFTPDHNKTWTATTRPILETFFHARFFLDMAVRYSTLDRPPAPLPSGYAALLYLYGLR